MSYLTNEFPLSRAQSEYQFEMSLSQFRSQIAENDRMYQELSQENLKLRKDLSEMTAKMKALEGQVSVEQFYELCYSMQWITTRFCKYFVYLLTQIAIGF